MNTALDALHYSQTDSLGMVLLCHHRRLFGKHGWTVAFTFNWIIFWTILVTGGGFGIWAAVKGEPLCLSAYAALWPAGNACICRA